MLGAERDAAAADAAGSRADAAVPDVGAVVVVAVGVGWPVPVAGYPLLEVF